MLAGDLITHDLISLRTSDTGVAALQVMGDYGVKHLPVVNESQLLALITEEDILNNDINEPLGSYDLKLHHPFAKMTDHMFEVMRVMAIHNLTVIPVVDLEGVYRGSISLKAIVEYFSKSYSFSEPGSLVVLKMPRRDYNLTQLSKLAQENNTSILSCFLGKDPEDEEMIIVTLKFNRQNIQETLSTYKRFGFDIIYTHVEEEFIDTLQERYEALMAYLNV